MVRVLEVRASALRRAATCHKPSASPERPVLSVLSVLSVLLLVLYVLYLDSALQGGAPFGP